MDFLIGMCVFVVLFGAIRWIGQWILGPIDRAAKAVRAPIRFSVADFLCLFIAIQLPLMLVNLLRSDDFEGLFWIFAVLTWVVAPIIWISCAIALSRAGITNGKSRMIFMGLVLPVVYYGLIPFVILPAAAIANLLDGEGARLLQYPWLGVLWVAIGAALIACGRFTNHVTRQILAKSS
jgi:hypothetical protein